MSRLHNSLLNSITSLITFLFNTFIRTLSRALGISLAFDLHMKLCIFWVFEVNANAGRRIKEEELGFTQTLLVGFLYWFAAACNPSDLQPVTINT